MKQDLPGNYSSHVELYLLVAGERYNVAQVANGSLILRDPRPIPPETAATLVVKIDSKEERSEVFLREGALDNKQFVPYF
ncbi:MAG: hypothetical protein AB7O59_16485 [Pirellulales bacterium]